MMVLGDKIELYIFGKFLLFIVGNVVNYGFEIDKCKLMSVFNQMDVLVFSFCVDNYLLILCEVLLIGVLVIVIYSDVVWEVL